MIHRGCGGIMFARVFAIQRRRSFRELPPMSISLWLDIGQTAVVRGCSAPANRAGGANALFFQRYTKGVALTIRNFGAVLAVSLALLFAGCSGKPSGTASAKTIKDRKPAPNFTLKDASGNSVKLSDFRGKVVLLNFWATWCGPCALEIPWFVEFQQQMKSRGLEVVGVSMDDEGWPAIKPFIAAHKVNYHVLLGDDSISQLYGGVDSLPTTFIIDRDGRIAVPPHVGLAGKNEYLQEIQSVLNEKQEGSSASTGGFLRLGTTAAAHR
jgi:peroxiredoxin